MSPVGQSAKGSKAAIITAAMRYLYRREYSRWELQNKLLAKAFDIEDIHIALNELNEQGYQSDERFTDNFLRWRIGKGNGPLKIKMELRQRGIAESVIARLLDNSDLDWLQLARKTRQKHFGTTLPTDARGLSKQIRYLRGKGFYQQHIETACQSPSAI